MNKPRSDKWRLPNKAIWLQDDMQRIINQMINAQDDAVESGRELYTYIRDNYEHDSRLSLLFACLSLSLQKANVKTSVLQQLIHDLETGNYKERDEDGHVLEK